MLLQGKNALVTGAAGGIGAAMLAVFAREGANVWAFARRQSDAFEQRCVELSNAHDVWIKPVYADLTNEAAVQDAVKQAMADKLPLDALVNNAGVMPEDRMFQMIPVDDMRAVFETNFFGVMRLTQLAARWMARRRQGAIVNVASVAGLQGDSRLDYSASKAALIAATLKQARELSALGLRVNAIAPGMTDTPMVADLSEKIVQETLGRVLLHRKARPEEIANVAAFLASDLSSYVNAQVWRVDGGEL